MKERVTRQTPRTGIEKGMWLVFFVLLLSNAQAQVPPNYEILVNTDQAYQGDVFFSIGGPPIKPVNIVSPSGELIFSENWPQEGFDWKVNDDGLITYYHRGVFGWITRDQNMGILDTTFCENGFTPDLHDFIRLPNGNKMMIAYSDQVYPMDLLVNGGDPNCVIETAIVQEIDSEQNVLFEWNALDHMSPTDLENANLTNSELTLNHANAIDIDGDGHIILCSRDLSEITKINHQTGEIMWRWGGSQNEFEFVNGHPFTAQHSARSLGNNHYIVFDNGNFSEQYTGEPNYSRALEYELDPVNMTATIVWQYVHPDSLHGLAMGSIQRLPNGNTFINWGTLNAQAVTGAIVSEVTLDGELAFEMVFALGENIYRCEKHIWQGAFDVEGCLDEIACNFDPEATISNGDCAYPEPGYDCDGNCLNDGDDDQVCDEVDNCPEVANLDQADEDEDGIGDLCDDDFGSGIDVLENTPTRQPVAWFNTLGQLLSKEQMKAVHSIWIIVAYDDGSTSKIWVE